MYAYWGTLEIRLFLIEWRKRQHSEHGTLKPAMRTEPLERQLSNGREKERCRRLAQTKVRLGTHSSYRQRP